MSNSLDQQLRKLTALWIDATEESLAHISGLAATIESLLRDGSPEFTIDPVVLQRLNVLANKATERISECVSIQCRSGAYSGTGTHEVAAQLSTCGWVG